MASIPNTIPTASQMLELASRLPQQEPPSPSEAHILLSIVDVCRTKWIRDFLFTPDPLHVRHFTSAAFANSAFISQNSCTLVEAPRPCPDGPLFGECRHTEGLLLFSPAFTAGDVTVGFCIQHSFITLGAPWLPEGRISHPMRFNCRFVRDMSRGLLFMVYYAPNRDILLIHCIRLRQTTCATRLNAMLRRQQFLESIHGDNGCLSTEAILKTLQFFTHDVQHRPCYVCGSPPSAFCICLLPRCDPAHPFDMHYFTSGMLQFFGEFESILSKVVCDDGQQKQHVVLASRTSCRGISAPAVAEDLKAWSLGEHARSLKEHPWKSPPSIASYGGQPSKPSSREGLANDYVLWVTEIQDSPVATAATTLVQSLLAVRIPCSSAAVMTNGLNNARRVEPPHSEEVRATGGFGTRLCSQHFLQIGEMPYENEETNEDHQPIPITSVLQLGNISELQTQTMNITSEELEFAISTGSGTAPLGAVQRRRIENECGELSITTELKEEIIKERNRASARRCNMRKRLLRERLKLELSTSQEKVARLREREVKLRKENIWLRTLLPDIDK